MKLKVINIVNHPPAYEGHRDRPRPKINWDTPNGSWVGIWGYEWHDIIGNNTLSVADDIEYEVWQPDQRADRIYQHTFETGLVHKLFPAIDKEYIHGLHKVKDIYSETLMIELEKQVQTGQPLVLHINAGLRYINIPILKKYHKKIPIVGQFYTNSSAIFDIPKTLHPAKLINAYKKKWELNRYYRMLKFLIPGVREGLDFFEKKFGTKVFYRDHANFGSDFSQWTRNKSKEEAREALNIPQDRKIIFSSSRLIPVKQIDKMIETLAKVRNQNFVCYVSGRGTPKYEEYLNNLVDKLNLKEKVVFIGYVDYGILKDYFQAADVLLSTSAQDLGPSTPFQAAFMEVPSILTKTGLAWEFFEDRGYGKLIPTEDYDKWVEALDAFMEGEQIPVPGLKELQDFGNWEIISKYYYNIYKTLQTATL
jgi:glycosyltransferase involved in cell wall biosynthesis